MSEGTPFAPPVSSGAEAEVRLPVSVDIPACLSPPRADAHAGVRAGHVHPLPSLAADSCRCVRDARNYPALLPACCAARASMNFKTAF